MNDTTTNREINELPGVGDILQRIPFQQHPVDRLVCLDGAGFLQLTEIQGWVVSGCGTCELQNTTS